MIVAATPLTLQALKEATLDLILVSIAVLILFSMFGWAILRAGALPPPASLITAMSLLTFLALIGFMITRAEELTALAGTGIGAVAGAVATTFASTIRRDDE